MSDLLFWTYMTNSILLISHEMDSVYWKEWELFKLPGGINGFLIIHFPLLFFVLYGLVQVHQGSTAGFIFSFVLSFAGIFAFAIHMFFIRRGRDEFKATMSLFILNAIFMVSIFQAFLTFYLLQAAGG